MTDFDSRTPAGRAQQLLDIELAQARRERASEDARHLPGSIATTAIARACYWEGRLAEVEAFWDREDRAWRAQAATAGEHPLPELAAAVRLAGRARDTLAGECGRLRQLRDRSLAECQSERDWLTEGWR